MMEGGCFIDDAIARSSCDNYVMEITQCQRDWKPDTIYEYSAQYSVEEYVPWTDDSAKARVPKRHWRLLSKNDRHLLRGDNNEIIEGKPIGERKRTRQLHFFGSPDPECVFCEIDVEATAELMRRKARCVAGVRARNAEITTKERLLQNISNSRK